MAGAHNLALIDKIVSILERDPTKIVLGQRDDEILEAVDKLTERIGKRLKTGQGVKIWVSLQADCCEQQPCCVFWSRLAWQQAMPWKECTTAAGAKGRQGPTFDANDKKGIAGAVAGCVKDALAGFTCKGGFNK